MRVRTGWRSKPSVAGFLGAGRGVGTTNLAIWTANYLSGARRERTAVLEWNDHGDFAKLGTFCIQTQRRFYTLFGVDYYAAAGAGDLAFCMEQGYPYILIDYGAFDHESLCECIRCDKSVLVGSLSDWRAAEFLSAANQIENRERWSYAAAFGSEAVRKEMEGQFHLKCLRVPFCPDAFVINGVALEFFQRFWK